MTYAMPVRIISGGQTGADQGGLKAARAEGYVTGGWAPRGWWTDEGAAPWLAEYGLQESSFRGYRVRTLLNVHAAQAVIWFGDPTSPGGMLTLGQAQQRQLRVLEVPYPWTWGSVTLARIRDFVFAGEVRDYTLMVAGNRERTNPGIDQYVQHVLSEGLIPF